jgi:hypothetical protein
MAGTSAGIAATPSIPVFQEEPIAAFSAALQHSRQRAVDSAHQSRTSYRAFRFVDPEMIIVGVASAITVDQNGRVHIVQAPGQPMGGRPNTTHQEYSHILLPITVEPPGH